MFTILNQTYKIKVGVIGFLVVIRSSQSSVQAMTKAPTKMVVSTESTKESNQVDSPKCVAKMDVTFDESATEDAPSTPVKKEGPKEYGTINTPSGRRSARIARKAH